MSERPNILYIFTDQQAAGAMSCAGNPDVKTPAMDGLAAAGVRFEKAYCAYPLCTPSRASMFTGRYPHEVGIVGNEQQVADEFRELEIGRVLSAAGYECVYGGKWHVPELSIPDGHGFRAICGFDDANLPERCAEFLARRHEKPFFLVAGFDNPHNICEWARDQVLPWGPIAEVPTDACPNLPANFAIPAFEPEAIRLYQESISRIYPTFRFTDLEWRHYRHAYFRLVEKVDAQIGRILEALRENGLEENTLVVFSSDHGDGHGAHRWSQKSLLYEEPTRVPLILGWKGVTRAGHVDADHLVSNGLDLFPTLSDYAGVEVPEGLRGSSLRPLVDASGEGREVESWRDHLVVETRFDEENTAGRMVRSSRYKYIVYDWGRHREQLFDMESDPGEMVNLAVEARFGDTLQRHRDLLAAWCEETGDEFGKHYSHGDVPFVLPGFEFGGEGEK